MTVELSVAAALAATGGRMLQQGAASGFRGVCIDSREVRADQAFVAIVGDRFDGHAYCGEAAAAGARLLVVHEEPAEAVPAGVAVLRDRLTLKALSGTHELFWGPPGRKFRITFRSDLRDWPRWLAEHPFDEPPPGPPTPSTQPR